MPTAGRLTLQNGLFAAMLTQLARFAQRRQAQPQVRSEASQKRGANYYWVLLALGAVAAAVWYYFSA